MSLLKQARGLSTRSPHAYKASNTSSTRIQATRRSLLVLHSSNVAGRARGATWLLPSWWGARPAPVHSRASQRSKGWRRGHRGEHRCSLPSLQSHSSPTQRGTIPEFVSERDPIAHAGEGLASALGRGNWSLKGLVPDSAGGTDRGQTPVRPPACRLSAPLSGNPNVVAIDDW